MVGPQGSGQVIGTTRSPLITDKVFRTHGCYPTEIKCVDGDIFAKRREDGKYIPIPPQKVERNRDNPDGRNHLCAPPPSVVHPSDTVYCFALGGAT